MSLQLAFNLLQDFRFKDKVLKDAQCLMKLLRWYIDVFGWNDDVRRLIHILTKGISSIGGARSWMSFGVYLAEIMNLRRNVQQDGIVKTALSLDTVQSLLSIAQGALGDVMTVGNSKMLPRQSVLMKKAGEMADTVWVFLSMLLLWKEITKYVRSGPKTSVVARTPNRKDTAEEFGEATEKEGVEQKQGEKTPTFASPPGEDNEEAPPSATPTDAAPAVENRRELLPVVKAAIDFGLAYDNFVPWVPDEGSNIILNLGSAFIGTYMSWKKHVEAESPKECEDLMGAEFEED